MADFLPVFQRETTSMIYCLLSCTLSPFGNQVYYKRKEFTPEKQIISFQSRPLLLWDTKTVFVRVASLASVFISLMKLNTD